MSDYIEAEKEVLAHYGVEYLGLSDRFCVPIEANSSNLFLDGHPNATGHKVLAERWIACLENENFNYLEQ